MTTVDQVITKLKAQGERITPLRKEIINLLQKEHRVISAIEIIDKIKKIKSDANKTTVYRELEFLKSKHLIHELHLGKKHKYYELHDHDHEHAHADDNDYHHQHHHHLVCTRCNKVTCIEVDTVERALAKQNMKILEQQGFLITEHFLEFFGLCEKCQKK